MAGNRYGLDPYEQNGLAERLNTLAQYTKPALSAPAPVVSKHPVSKHVQDMNIFDPAPLNPKYKRGPLGEPIPDPDYKPPAPTPDVLGRNIRKAKDLFTSLSGPIRKAYLAEMAKQPQGTGGWIEGGDTIPPPPEGVTDVTQRVIGVSEGLNDRIYEGARGKEGERTFANNPFVRDLRQGAPDNPLLDTLENQRSRAIQSDVAAQRDKIFKAQQAYALSPKSPAEAKIMQEIAASQGKETRAAAGEQRVQDKYLLDQLGEVEEAAYSPTVAKIRAEQEKSIKDMTPQQRGAIFGTNDFNQALGIATLSVAMKQGVKDLSDPYMQEAYATVQDMLARQTASHMRGFDFGTLLTDQAMPVNARETPISAYTSARNPDVTWARPWEHSLTSPMDENENVRTVGYNGPQILLDILQNAAPLDAERAKQAAERKERYRRMREGS